MKLGIIGAMTVEVENLKSQMQDVTIVNKAGMEFYEGTLEQCPVVVVKCRIDFTNTTTRNDYIQAFQFAGINGHATTYAGGCICQEALQCFNFHFHGANNTKLHSSTSMIPYLG